MAPGTRRANRSGYAEHDDFEGLPVRQWRQEWVTVAPPPQQEQQKPNDIWSIELLHGMPKDSNLLPPHSQELLLAARSGRLYKRPAPIEDEETDADALPESKDKKEEDASAKGFSMKVWKQIAKNVEAPTVSHLAKRQKNTVTIASKTVEERVQGPTVTRATVRRVDAAGNPYTEEVTLADGQQVVGEIISTRVEVAPVPPGQAAAPVPPPVRKRPNPPKRKPKGGPGRGKKRVKFPAPGAPEATPTAVAPVNGTAPAATVKPEQTSETAIKQETDDQTNHDSEVAEGDDDDDDEEGDDGDEGDEGDESATPGDSTQREGSLVEVEKQDHEMSDATPIPPPIPTPTITSTTDHSDVEMGGNEIHPEQPPHNTLAPVPPLNLASTMSRLEGSPLKNVIMPSPTTELPPELPPVAQHDAQPQVPLTEEVVQKIEAAPGVDETKPGPEAQSIVTQPPSTVAEPAVVAGVSSSLPAAAAAAPTASLTAPVDIADIAAPPAPIPTPLEDVVPKTESPREESLLPPPPEQVGNIDSTPPAEGSTSTVLDGAEKPVEARISEEPPSRPPLEHTDTIMTEDTVKPDDSASVTAPLSEAAEVPPPEPTLEPVAEPTLELLSEPVAEAMAIDDIQMEDAPEASSTVPVESVVETTAATIEEAPLQETKQASPPNDEEPNLLNSLLGELDRQTESMEVEAAEQVTPAEPVSEPAPETVVENSPEKLDETMDTVEEPVAVEAATTSSEAPVVPPAEPPAEVAAEPTLEVIPEPAPGSAAAVEPVEESELPEDFKLQEHIRSKEVSPLEEPKLVEPAAPGGSPDAKAEEQAQEVTTQHSPVQEASEADPPTDPPAEPSTVDAPPAALSAGADAGPVEAVAPEVPDAPEVPNAPEVPINEVPSVEAPSAEAPAEVPAPLSEVPAEVPAESVPNEQSAEVPSTEEKTDVSAE